MASPIETLAIETPALAPKIVPIRHAHRICSHTSEHTCYCLPGERAEHHYRLSQKPCQACWNKAVMHHQGRITRACGCVESVEFLGTWDQYLTKTGPVKEAMRQRCARHETITEAEGSLWATRSA